MTYVLLSEKWVRCILQTFLTPEVVLSQNHNSGFEQAQQSAMTEEALFFTDSSAATGFVSGRRI